MDSQKGEVHEGHQSLDYKLYFLLPLLISFWKVGWGYIEKGGLFRTKWAAKLGLYHDKKGHFHVEKGHVPNEMGTFMMKRDILLMKSGNF